MGCVRDFHGYRCYSDSMKLCEAVYRASDAFPEDERWELRKQIRRAAVSVPSNIAEGAGRRSGIEFARFIEIAVGSLNEVETHLELARRLDYLGEETTAPMLALITSTRRQLRRLTQTVRSDPATQ